MSEQDNAGYSKEWTQPTLAPHSEEAEKALLGGLLVNPTAMGEIADILTPADFFLLHHGWIFNAMLSLHRSGMVIDQLTVNAYLESRKQAEAVGGELGLMALTVFSADSSSEALITYAKLIKGLSTRKALQKTIVDLASIAYDENLSSKEAIQQVVAAVQTLDLAQAFRHSLDPVEKELLDFQGHLDDLKAGTAKPKVMPTHIKIFDNLLTGGGLPAGLTLVISRTSGGKTAMMLTWFLNQLVEMAKQKLPSATIGYFSMEMKLYDLLLRLTSRLSGIPLEKLADGSCPDEDKPKLAAAHIKMNDLAPYMRIDSTTFHGIDDIVAKIRQAVLRDNMKCVYVDYASLIAHKNRKKQEQRYEVLSEYSRLLHALGIELEIPIVMAVQTNREGDGSSLKDIAESYNQSTHAALIVGLVDMPDSDQTAANLIKDLFILKQRNGRKGKVSFAFHQATQTFTAMPPVYENKAS